MRKAPVIFFHTGKKPFLFCFFAYLALIAAISALCLNMPAAKRIFFDEEFMRGAFPIVCGVSPYGAFPLAAEKHADNTPREASSGQKNYKKEKGPGLSLQKTSTRISPPSSGVSLNNASGLNISRADYTKSAAFSLKDCSVLIIHTHATESYTPSKAYPYTPTDTDRTTDNNFNMVRVGDEVEKVLKENGINVYHDTSQNDYPSYNKSYQKSCTAAQSYIKKDPSIKIILDIHRDAAQDKNGNKIACVSEIEGKRAASVMLVVGSNASGLEHDLWRGNLSFAYALQAHTLALYPGLFRPINLRSQRFNQHLAPAAVIVEIGTNGNTLDEALLGARLFSEGLCSFINQSAS